MGYEWGKSVGYGLWVMNGGKGGKEIGQGSESGREERRGSGLGVWIKGRELEGGVRGRSRVGMKEGSVEQVGDRIDGRMGR